MGSTSESGAGGFTAQERAAMKDRAAELREQAGQRGKGAAAAKQEAAVLATIAEMPDVDRVLAEQVHAIVREHAPQLAPRTWYGQPAYARDGRVVCFFQAASKFDTRFATLGFNDVAELEDGPMWPTAFSLTSVTPEVERTVAALVRRAAG
ncbi:iron chaperone [Cellulomonas phragmiteti]|uniref:YdhG-like domain-containing protein n=1 Tax=Cellulomonas phragmiteti TaxID=478780 RepID=A0ABQ4DHG6_9CELL|nr:DUF1801 domain-containing protein [Cellulomonas phragmiteti]GIG38361.1 hypothetical protein Cph01nite_01230 [Cellulomonas phragmiteti]